MLRAASNPDSERIDVVMASLPKKRRGMVNRTAGEVREITGGIVERGRVGLEALSDDEWERLLDE